MKLLLLSSLIFTSINLLASTKGLSIPQERMMKTFPKALYKKPIEGVMYKIGSERKEVLYKVKLMVDPVAKAPKRIEFFDLRGQLVATENLVYEGEKLLSYSYDLKNAEESGKITMTDEKVSFNYRQKNDKESGDEKRPSNFVVGPLVSGMAMDNLDLLFNGKDVDFKYGVSERQDIFSFYLKLKQKTQTQMKFLKKFKCTVPKNL